MGYQVYSVRPDFSTSTSLSINPVFKSKQFKSGYFSLSELGFSRSQTRDKKGILHLDSCGGFSPTTCRVNKFGYCLKEWKVGYHQAGASSSNEQLTEQETKGGFFEAIEELEHMGREPADILDDMQKKLSTRDLHLVLVYFAQEGRDSWCALEVFDWMRKGNKVDDETVELMLSIMSSWLSKLVEEELPVEEVQNLLKEMNCVGLKPSYDMVETVISLYWARGKRSQAVQFVKYLLQAGGAVVDLQKDQDPAGHLIWKMSMDGEYREAVKLLFELRRCGLKPKIYSYVTAIVAVVMEQNQFTRTVHKLRAFQKKGRVAELDLADKELLDTYQRNLHKDGEQIAKWAIEENTPEFVGKIHEELLAMYTVAVRGVEAEHHLWQMKLAGREPATEMYDAVLAICAVEKNLLAVGRLMAGMEAAGKPPSKKTYSWLLRGYMKGGHFEEAAKALLKMLDKGLYPERLEMTVVLKGLQRNLQKMGGIELYLKLCKHLSNAGQNEPKEYMGLTAGAFDWFECSSHRNAPSLGSNLYNVI